MILVVLFTIQSAGLNPLDLFQRGTRYSEVKLNGTEGYDCQFVYYMARNLDPEEVEAYFDVPAYTYKCFLLPLLSHYLVLGRIDFIPWMIPLIGILAQGLGTFALMNIFRTGA